MLEAVVFVISFLIGFLIGKKRGKSHALRYLTLEQLKMRHDNLQKILEHLSYHDNINDEEVGRMFNVPRQIADAYLKDLEHQGRIVQISKKGDIETYTIK